MAQSAGYSDVAVTTPPIRAERWAWGICWLMFASTVLNYMDRQSIALVGPMIQKEFKINFVDFGWVLASFQLTYALFQVPAGYLVDRWNVRWAYAGAVAFWSLAGMAAAFAPTLAVLMVLRALLGVGESFNWPCGLRANAMILPPADRSLGNGIFNSGAAVGAVLTPLVVPVVAAKYGWRTAFVVVGLLGFLWVGVWLIALGGRRRDIFAGRSASKPVSADDLMASESPSTSGLSRQALFGFGSVVVAALVVSSSAVQFGKPAIWWGITVLMVGLLLAALRLPMHALKGADWAQSLGEIVRLRRFWILVLVSITINVCWHFLINWLPSFLINDRGMKYLAGGLFSTVPFLAADVGNIGGGALSSFLARRGMSAIKARLLVIALCTLLITGGALVGSVSSNFLALLLIAFMAMGTAAFMANYFAFVQEVSPYHTGLVAGILGGLGNLFAAGFHPVVGWVKDTTGSFGVLFVIVGLIPYLGLGALVLGWGSESEELKSS
ncbi:MFS transporter, ACS family, hexuronate transporter [Singulisphaera sp. GP187]|uniref:MFS transporter n=1 Tax=Singulisphaera sp. GP187 TaxID=1882752 RepID=UPI0009298FF8|nr:MFS transporter [Singulisphaera sp. GP187]SIO58637.1 MFS transporter, ACS family, hexuronate transporter [Singulisphaera sp. GP187]